MFHKIIAGIDIGNSTTEVVLIDQTATGFAYIASHMTATTGVKGTKRNAEGCLVALKAALQKAGLHFSDLSAIRINHAAPVISDLSMDTVSETSIIGSAMIGHNPDTPAGSGLAVGTTAWLDDLQDASIDYIVLIDNMPYYQAVAALQNALSYGYRIVGAIVKNDDAVLIANRIPCAIPIVDEVLGIAKIPIGAIAAMEVAPHGKSIEMLSNPYTIASIFDLSAQETKNSIPIARSLVGCKSGVVIRAEHAGVQTKTIPAGKLTLIGERTITVDVNAGADKIMEALHHAGALIDITGEAQTNAGALFAGIKQSMATLTEQNPAHMKITGLLAADTFAAVEVLGAIAGEVAMENVVMLAAMVSTQQLAMDKIAHQIEESTGVTVQVYGKEADMALTGALTTKGTQKPLAILDLGGGSTDAALITQSNEKIAIHNAGAGEMVTRIIDLALHLKNRDLAELIKKYPLAKVDGLLSLHFEDGGMKFLSQPLPPSYFSRIVVVTDDGLVPLPQSKRLTIDKVVQIRRDAKRKIFVVNAIRSLKAVAPNGEIRNIDSVVLVGGSAQDFEIADMLAEHLSNYRIAVGKANMLGFLPPHSAVALGLAISGCKEQHKGGDG